MISPKVQPPSFDMIEGRSYARLNAAIGNTVDGFNLVLPITLAAGQTTTTGVIDFRGFDSFTCWMKVSVVGPNLYVVLVDPFDGITELGEAGLSGPVAPNVNTAVPYLLTMGLPNLYHGKLRVRNDGAGASNLTSFGPLILES